MRYIKMIGLAAMATMALMAVSAGSASATTLEVTGVKQLKAVTISATLAAGTSAELSTTSSEFVDTCTTSAVSGKTETTTGTTVGGKVTGLSFTNCTHTTHVKANGSLTVENAGNTNGTVRSTGAEVQVQSTSFGVTLTCKTDNTHLGTLTGSLHGHATLNIKAVVDCGFFAPTANWVGTYTVTSPTGLGVVA
jgi:hypothetical protein